MNHLSEEIYMQRCIQLALLGAGNVSPNPMVGAVLVYEDTIIGEGYHAVFGQAHAEVNCINSVEEKDKSKISKSTLFVSLEPCAHFGKTPPCADLIIKNKIVRVVIGCKDIFAQVAGRGIKRLRDAGVEVITEVLEKECIELNKRFFTFHQIKRPYIILKWAQSFNHKIGSLSERVLISNDYSNRLVHKMRSEEASILVGTKTASMDNPSLTTRLWKGQNPMRIIIDSDLKLDTSLNIFNKEAPTIIFNTLKNEMIQNIRYIRLNRQYFLFELLHSLYNLNINSVFVEGGAKTSQSFIDSGIWDEAVVITNEKLHIQDGVDAPDLKSAVLNKQVKYLDDTITYYTNTINIID
ncbi:MAG: bifunctional diaminohydroxyphosphoribosylaminopyrimidine deaminase/5-amino-6-(5-phosphoribosylamino)uracil reductase RibD [Ginsengibacter sp.]